MLGWTADVRLLRRGHSAKSRSSCLSFDCASSCAVSEDDHASLTVTWSALIIAESVCHTETDRRDDSEGNSWIATREPIGGANCVAQECFHVSLGRARCSADTPLYGNSEIMVFTLVNVGEVSSGHLGTRTAQSRFAAQQAHCRRDDGHGVDDCPRSGHEEHCSPLDVWRASPDGNDDPNAENEAQEYSEV